MWVCFFLYAYQISFTLLHLLPVTVEQKGKEHVWMLAMLLHSQHRNLLNQDCALFEILLLFTTSGPEIYLIVIVILTSQACHVGITMCRKLTRMAFLKFSQLVQELKWRDPQIHTKYYELIILRSSLYTLHATALNMTCL